MSEPERLLRAIENVSRFNARRSLGVAEDSAFESTKFGTAVAFTDPARPRLPMFNRVLGLGPGHAGQIAAILNHYKALGCQPHFDLDAGAIVPELISVLVARGFEPTEALQYYSGTPGSQAPRSKGVPVDHWDPCRADDFRGLLENSGVSCEDAVWENRRALYCSDEFRVFVAQLDGKPCAWATLFVDRDKRTGYLANAYTEPDFRRRGCQLALLEARLADAQELGLKQVYTDVIAESISARNCARAGLRKLTALTLWRGI